MGISSYLMNYLVNIGRIITLDFPSLFNIFDKNHEVFLIAKNYQALQIVMEISGFLIS